MGGGRGDRMVLVDAAENPGRLGYQLCGPWPSILVTVHVLPCRPRALGSALRSQNSFERPTENGSCCSGGGAWRRPTAHAVP